MKHFLIYASLLLLSGCSAAPKQVTAPAQPPMSDAVTTSVVPDSCVIGEIKTVGTVRFECIEPHRFFVKSCFMMKGGKQVDVPCEESHGGVNTIRWADGTQCYDNKAENFWKARKDGKCYAADAPKRP